MITIDDSDVEWAASLLRCSFDAPRVAFLKAQSSCDLHACPGSGKTTLLVAKLAILSRRWPWRDRGILVLSHTNVARQEIEQRLSKDPSSARLLGYPHFVGTIQAFVHRFLALPFLRDVGVGGQPIEDPTVDDEAFEHRATALFFSRRGWQEYPQARSSLKRRREEGRSTVATLYYKGADMALATASGHVPKAATPSGQQLRALKDRLSKDGTFRYKDMLAFAKASLAAHPFIGDSLRARFPWVFIDEMQDTDSEQELLLDQLYRRSGTILHKLGDQNQAIYAEALTAEDQNAFSWTDTVELPQSQRLAPKLAELVSPLAIVHPLRLQGNPGRVDRRHTIFLFDDSTIAEVLPAFGDLIVQQWNGALPPSFVAKAVGFRRRPHETPVIPSSLIDYWSGYKARPSEDANPHRSLLASVRHAQQLLRASGELYAAYRAIFAALAELRTLHEGARVTPRGLQERCRTDVVDGKALKSAIARLFRSECVKNGDAWARTVRPVHDLIAPGSRSAELASFLAWNDDNLPNTVTGIVGHTFMHRANEVTVPIEVSTIHAVKGETHDATLVLETRYYEHDLELAVPLLLGGSAPSLDRGRLTGHMKRLFVAASRPKELLCLAMHGSHVSDVQVASLREAGWYVAPLKRM